MNLFKDVFADAMELVMARVDVVGWACFYSGRAYLHIADAEVYLADGTQINVSFSRIVDTPAWIDSLASYIVREAGA